MEKKILVTGFEPFGKDTVNPSWEAVKSLPDKIGNAVLIKREVPVLFDGAADEICSLAHKEKADGILCCGLANGRQEISLEFCAINWQHARIPDNNGKQPLQKYIDPQGPRAMFSALPVYAIARALEREGIPASVSYSAGTYVCNDVMYRILQTAEKLNIPAGFVHVPAWPGMNKQHHMDPHEIEKGLKTVIEHMMDPEIQEQSAHGTLF